MKPYFQLSSLKHLVLLGFFISLIPLYLLLWQSNAIQREVSLSSISFTKQSINFVRTAVEMDGLLVDIERAVKQFIILESKPFERLAITNINHYQSLVKDLCTDNDLKLDDFCSGQLSDITTLSEHFTLSEQEELDLVFQVLRKRQSEMMERLWLFLDDSTEDQQKYADDQQALINVWLIGIATVSFFLVVLISGRIAAPVKQLEEKIKTIGSGKQLGNEAVETFSGPNELRMIYEKLNWLAARLEQLESLRQSFLRHASHEFKTPLSSIQEGCSILSEQLAGPLTKQQGEVLALLEESTHRLRHLTEQLLDYNYLLQQQEPELEELNPSEFLEKISSGYDQSLSKRQQRLSIDCNLTSICTDHKLFTRIVENLLSNAQAYGVQNGKVCVQLKQIQSSVVLIIANTGPKISKEHTDHLFEPFYRAGIPRHDALRGTGLGLSIVNDCARLLGGHVELIELASFDFAVKVEFPVY